ncbi:MAG TPA: hypothetical protein VF240_16715 [Pyrinomonadaceae bacterium]
MRVPVEQVPWTLRDVEHIPPEEIQAAMLLIVGHAVGIGVDSLLSETARLFGFSRVGDRIRERLLGQLKSLTRARKLALSGDSVTLRGTAAR